MDFAFPVLQQPTSAAEPTPLPQSPTPAATSSPASAPAADAAPPSGSSQQQLPLNAFSTGTHVSTSAAAEPRLPLTALSTTTHAAAPGSSPAPRLPLTAFSTVTHATSAAAEPVPASSSTSSDPLPSAGAAAAGRGTGFDKGARSQVEYLRSQQGTLSGAPAPSVPLRPISLAELSQHKAVGDAWIALKGRVYDVTRYVQYHPGGARVLLKAAGTDATQVFAKFHPWVDAHYILAASQLGTLVEQGGEAGEAGPGEEAGQGTAGQSGNRGG